MDSWNDPSYFNHFSIGSPNRHKAIPLTHEHTAHRGAYALLGLNELTHWGLVTPYGVRDFFRHWLRWWYMSPVRCQAMIWTKWTPANKRGPQHEQFFFQENAFEIVVCYMVAIFRTQCASYDEGHFFLPSLVLLIWTPPKISDAFA